MKKRKEAPVLYEYSYDGPVEEFGRCIAHRWCGTTYAVSAAKAKTNLIYQFKTQTKRALNTQISLPGKVEIKGSRKETGK